MKENFLCKSNEIMKIHQPVKLTRKGSIEEKRNNNRIISWILPFSIFIFPLLDSSSVAISLLFSRARLMKIDVPMIILLIFNRKIFRAKWFYSWINGWVSSNRQWEHWKSPIYEAGWSIPKKPPNEIISCRKIIISNGFVNWLGII